MSRLRTLLDSRARVAIMGVLNRTPDSFSDGGLHAGEREARARIEAMVAEGADLIDIGAESTRPGAQPISAAEQIARLGGSVRDAVRLGAIVSIDTTSPVVAERALAEGADIVNSVSLDVAATLGAICARRGAALVLMHSRGPMAAMPGYSTYPDDAYDDVVAEVARALSAAAERAMEAGLPREEIVLDPGLGFAKNARQSLALCARLDALCALGFPVLVGPSRKSFLAHAAAAADPGCSPSPPHDRLGGTIAAALACAARGAAVLRVHDVAAVKQALAVARALEGERSSPRPQDRGRATALAPRASTDA